MRPPSSDFHNFSVKMAHFLSKFADMRILPSKTPFSVIFRTLMRTLGRRQNPLAAASIFSSQLQPTYVGKAIHNCYMLQHFGYRVCVPPSRQGTPPPPFKRWKHLQTPFSMAKTSNTWFRTTPRLVVPPSAWLKLLHPFFCRNKT